MQQHSKWTEELIYLASILDELPLEKQVKWGADVYTFEGKNVVSFGGFKQFCSLWFYNGVFLSDPYGVLVSASEGKTKSLRQWRFTSKSEINAEKIKEYVLEAIEIEKKGLKIKAEKHVPLELNDLLKQAFSIDTSFQLAFENLSSGKQKEYINYINEAKQEATKFSRLEKIRPLVLQKIGLNDKYKK
jgi:uncharacterized protein YdeI (YjbR/CyaY-like superfamily)